MQQMVFVEISRFRKRFDQFQPALESLRHRNRHGSVQRHDWRRLYLLESIVQPHDLRPVGVLSTPRLAVTRGNCSLQRKWTGSSAKSFLDQRQRLINLLAVP